MRKQAIAALALAGTIGTAVAAKWVDEPRVSPEEKHMRTAANLSAMACGSFDVDRLHQCPDDFPDFTFLFAACMVGFEGQTETDCLNRMQKEFSAALMER